MVGYDYQDAPTHVPRMFVQAIEIGYSQALREVREGRYDAEIQSWRPRPGAGVTEQRSSTRQPGLASG